MIIKYPNMRIKSFIDFSSKKSMLNSIMTLYSYHVIVTVIASRRFNHHLDKNNIYKTNYNGRLLHVIPYRYKNIQYEYFLHSKPIPLFINLAEKLLPENTDFFQFKENFDANYTKKININRLFDLGFFNHKIKNN